MIGYTVKKVHGVFTVYLVLLGEDGGDDHEVAHHREDGQGRHDGNLEDHTWQFLPIFKTKNIIVRSRQDSLASLAKKLHCLRKARSHGYRDKLFVGHLSEILRDNLNSMY